VLKVKVVRLPFEQLGDDHVRAEAEAWARFEEVEAGVAITCGTGSSTRDRPSNALFACWHNLPLYSQVRQSSWVRRGHRLKPPRASRAGAPPAKRRLFANAPSPTKSAASASVN
jgi:hypothetical protein